MLFRSVRFPSNPSASPISHRANTQLRVGLHHSAPMASPLVGRRRLGGGSLEARTRMEMHDKHKIHRKGKPAQHGKKPRGTKYIKGSTSPRVRRNPIDRKEVGGEVDGLVPHRRVRLQRGHKNEEGGTMIPLLRRQRHFWSPRPGVHKYQTTFAAHAARPRVAGLWLRFLLNAWVGGGG